MAHHTQNETRSHDESKNGWMVVISLLLFFAMSLIGHYVWGGSE